LTLSGSITLCSSLLSLLFTLSLQSGFFVQLFTFLAPLFEGGCTFLFLFFLLGFCSGFFCFSL